MLSVNPFQPPAHIYSVCNLALSLSVFLSLSICFIQSENNLKNLFQKKNVGPVLPKYYPSSLISLGWRWSINMSKQAGQLLYMSILIFCKQAKSGSINTYKRSEEHTLIIPVTPTVSELNEWVWIGTITVTAQKINTACWWSLFHIACLPWRGFLSVCVLKGKRL